MGFISIASFRLQIVETIVPIDRGNSLIEVTALPILETNIASAVKYTGP
jgi:hypothetical protein